MKRVLLYAVVLLSMAAAGCATTGDVERVEQKVGSAKSELSSVRGGVEELVQASREDRQRVKQTLEALSADVAVMKEELELIKRNQANLGASVNSMAGGEMTSFSGRMDELRHEVESSKAKLDAFKAAILQRLAEMEEALAPQASGGPAASSLEGRSIPAGSAGGTGAEGGTASAGAQPPVGDPLQMYQAAYLDYTKGNYEYALMGFKDYLASFPDGEFAGNAQYWIGESLYSLGQYNEALIEFEKVLSDHPDSPKAPGAMLKEGFCFDAIGRKEDAKAVYTKVTASYPSSDAARIAADRLKTRERGQVPARSGR